MLPSGKDPPVSLCIGERCDISETGFIIIFLLGLKATRSGNGDRLLSIEWLGRQIILVKMGQVRSMDYLAAMAAFVRSVDLGSFSKAAAESGLKVSTVSR